MRMDVLKLGPDIRLMCKAERPAYMVLLFEGKARRTLPTHESHAPAGSVLGAVDYFLQVRLPSRPPRVSAAHPIPTAPTELVLRKQRRCVRVVE